MDRRDLLVFAAAMTASSALAQAPVDHNLPKDPNAKGMLGPLRVITIVTSDLEGMTKMYRDGMGMELTGPIPLDVTNRNNFRVLWKMPDGTKYDIYMLKRPNVPQAAQIRLVVVKPETPAVRKSWNRQELGPYGMGFPTTDVEAWDKHVTKLGFKRATPEIERFPLKRSDGTPYDVLEATFNGPEFLRNIAISRRDGMAQVGDVDPATGRGGPSYATMIVDDMEAMINFFTRILDMEVRVDRIWTAYDIPFRFVTLYAKGSTHGHIALASYEKQHVVPGTGVRPGLPNRGMAMLTFEVPDMQAAGKRVESFKIYFEGAYSTLTSDDIGERSGVMFAAPNGIIVEMIERPVKK
jgi:catechol 2,3-dioxygenase-like lactoylglutathione lyase family enzyme